MSLDHAYPITVLLNEIYTLEERRLKQEKTSLAELIERRIKDCRSAIRRLQADAIADLCTSAD